MEAGEGAERVALDAEAAATTLERKAAYARQRAASFRAGAEGERSTAYALAPLTVLGWQLLHDRALPHGGNIDHLVISPDGVFVIDTKNWSAAVTIGASGVRAGGRSRAKDIDRLGEVRSVVELALRSAGYTAPVRAVLALAGGTDRAMTPTRIADDIVAMGVDQLEQALRRSVASDRPSAAVDAITACLARSFPPTHVDPQAAIDELVLKAEPARDLFNKGNVFLYVEPWSKAGRSRLYLNDEHGENLGHKDLMTGVVSANGEADVELVRGVLRNADATGLHLDRKQLPHVPIQIRGGRLLGSVGRLWSNLLVARHWRRGNANRLYVTRAVVSEQEVYDVGYIDLSTGTLRPVSDRPLGSDQSQPARYLELVLSRYPRK